MKPSTKQLADELIAAIKSHVERQLEPLRMELHALEARVMMQQQQIAELEAKASEPATRHLRAL